MTKNNKLPRELVSIIQHVELNSSGWWKAGLAQLLMLVFWNSGRELSISEAREKLREEFEIVVPDAYFESATEELLAEGSIVEEADLKYRLSHSANRAFAASVEKSEKIIQGAQEHFFSVMERFCPSRAEVHVWKDFNSEFLVPFLCEQGARTFDILFRRRGTWNSDLFKAFVSKYPTDVHEEMEQALSAFLEGDNELVKEYVLGYLNTSFYLEAFQLDAGSIEYAVKIPESRPEFKIIVDTNFALSLLGLHENPSTEAALELRTLVQGVSEKIDVRFYEVPGTLKEIKGYIEKTKKDFGNLILSPVRAEATLAGNCSGALRSFAERVIQAGQPMGAAEFFSPYVSDLPNVLRDRGVEILPVKLDDILQADEVKKLIKTELDREASRKDGKGKSREKLRHDIGIWKYTLNRRPAIIENVLDAKFWFVTLDFRLIRFDENQRQLVEGEKVCIHPSSLIQILQFFSPRSEGLDNALFDNLKLPFIFREFNKEDEIITVRILRVISRYENVDDMSPLTIRKILFNSAIRAKFSEDEYPEGGEEAIKEVIVDENVMLSNDLKSKNTRVEALAEEVDGLSEERDVESEKAAKLLQELAVTLSEIQSRDESDRVSKVRTDFYMRHLIWPVLGGLILFFVISLFMNASGLGISALTNAAYVFYAAVVLLWAAFVYKGRQREDVVSDPEFKKYSGISAGILTLISIFGFPAVSWDYLSRIISDVYKYITGF